MKYVVLVLVAFLGLGSGLPAAARATTAPAQVDDPLSISFPAYQTFNPDAVPYVITVHDAAPDQGELRVVVNPQNGTTWGEYALPHDGEFTVPLDDYSVSGLKVWVERCPAAGGTCIRQGDVQSLTLVRQLDMELRTNVALGPRSRVPVKFGVELRKIDVVHLDWVLTAVGGGTITSGAADYVGGDPLPSLGLPVTDVLYATLRVDAVTDSPRLGVLEDSASETYDLDFAAPPLRLSLSDGVVFPANDGYRDQIFIRAESDPTDLRDISVRILGDGVEPFEVGRGSSWRQSIPFAGMNDERHAQQLPEGVYTIEAVATDLANNTTLRSTTVRVDDREEARARFLKTVTPRATLVDRFVGACSRLGAAAGRGWSGSLGFYSTAPCRKTNGSVVATVHGIRLPPALEGRYHDNVVKLSVYGGAARGARSAYLVHGWFSAEDAQFMDPTQFSGRMGSHTVTAWSDVVRTIDGQAWVFFQLGLSGGSRYDVKDFTVRYSYDTLVEPATSRAAAQGYTRVEPAAPLSFSPPSVHAVGLLDALT